MFTNKSKAYIYMLFKIQPNYKLFHSEFILLSEKNYIKAEAFFIFYENLFNFVSSTYYTAHEFNFFKLSYLLFSKFHTIE